VSLVDQVRKLEQQVVDRLKELEPLTREYDQLRKVAERLGLKYSPGSGQINEAATSATKARRPRKRAPAAKRPARRPATAKASRPRASARAAKSAAKPRGTRSTTAPKEATAARSAPARQRKRAASGQRSSGRRAAARPGQRHEDVLRLVGEHPGITVREIGERLGVDATGLYRVVNRLTDEGRVRKDGVRLQPVDASTASAPKPETPGETAKQTPATAGTQPPAPHGSKSESSTTAADTVPSGRG
jgi:hypothetical protein